MQLNSPSEDSTAEIETPFVQVSVTGHEQDGGDDACAQKCAANELDDAGKDARAPRLDRPEPGKDKPDEVLPRWLRVSSKPPVVHALIVANTLMFAAMAGMTGIKSLYFPSSQVLLHFGASSGAATIIDGQFWRALTSAFVHFGFFHLMMNCYVLWDIGPLVEKLYGSRKFLVIYAMGALGAALSSLLFDPTVVSAGASGAIFGMFGALMSFFWRHRRRFPDNFLK
ncbi:MAG: rhomboid family intramembrane serine protease, partial [Terriglobales bacterium]